MFEIPRPVRAPSLHVAKPVMAVPVGLKVVRLGNVIEIRAPARRRSLHVAKPVMAVPVGLKVVRLGNHLFPEVSDR